MKYILSSYGLSALAWLHCFAVLWMLMRGVVEPGWDIAGMWLFGFLVAIGAAAKRR